MKCKFGEPEIITFTLHQSSMAMSAPHAVPAMERILAVFTMSANGLTTIADAPKAFIHAVVDYFRTPDGSDWNREIVGVNDVSVQCLSHVIRGLAKISGDDSLLEKARKHRRASINQNPGFFAFQYSRHPLDQELLGYVNFFLEESKIRPTDVQSAVQHMAAWLTAEVPGASVRDNVFDADRPRTFTDYMLEKNGGEVSRGMFVVVDAARKLSVSITEQLSERACGRTMFDLVTRQEHSNPQFLRLLADAFVQSNRSFTSKRQIFRSAVEHLAVESGSGLRGPVRPPTAEIVEALAPYPDPAGADRRLFDPAPGIVLRAARVALAANQEDLAKLAGIAHTTIRRLEQSDPAVPLELGYKLEAQLKAMGVEIKKPDADAGWRILLRKTPRQVEI